MEALLRIFLCILRCGSGWEEKENTTRARMLENWGNCLQARRRRPEKGGRWADEEGEDDEQTEMVMRIS